MLTIMNEAVISICVQVSMWMHIFNFFKNQDVFFGLSTYGKVDLPGQHNICSAYIAQIPKGRKLKVKQDFYYR